MGRGGRSKQKEAQVRSGVDKRIEKVPGERNRGWV